MTSRKATQYKDFLKRFHRYWRLKRFNGSAESKENPEFVDSVGFDYFEIIQPHIGPDLYDAFFKHLEFEQSKFVEPHELKKVVYAWTANRRKRIEGDLSDDFRNYLWYVESYAIEMYRQDKLEHYRIIKTMCNQMELWDTKKYFIGYDLPEAIDRFWNWGSKSNIKEFQIKIFKAGLDEHKRKLMAEGNKYITLSASEQTDMINQMTENIGRKPAYDKKSEDDTDDQQG